MKAKKLGVGIIGAGRISYRHARACAALSRDCEVVAVADVVPERAEELARSCGGARAFSDPKDLLALPEVELVILCTPPFAHLENALDALAAGKHVLCEKPMAGSPEECDRMIAEAASRNLLLAGATQHRFGPAVRQAKALLDSGELGRPLLAVASGLWWRSKDYYDVGWRGTWEQECGGTLLNHHCHYLDLLLYLLGDAAWVRCEMGAQLHAIEVEDTALLHLGFPGGALASVVATSADHHGSVTRLEIGCERAALTIAQGEPLRISVARGRTGGYPEPDADAAGRLERLAARLAPPPQYTDHEAVLHDVLQSLRTGRVPFIHGSELRRSVDLAMGAYQSASLECTVHLPLKRGDPFYTREGILKSVRRSARGVGKRAAAAA